MLIQILSPAFHGLPKHVMLYNLNQRAIVKLIYEGVMD